MTVLHTKLARELWQLRSQALAIALVIGGGVAVCLMSIVNYSSLQETRTRYYEDFAFADVFSSLKRAPRHVSQRIAAIPGIARISDRVEGLAKLEIPGFDDPVSARLVSLPVGEEPRVNQLFMRQGRVPAGNRNNEVAVIGSFAEAHGLTPGDTLRAVINGHWQVLRVVGIVESPEFIYVLPPGGVLPDYERYGVMWMSREALAAAMDMKGAFNSLVATIESGHSVADVIDQVDLVLERYGGTGAYRREDQLSHRFLDDELRQLGTMAMIFPVIFMSVAMFLLHVVIGRLVATQREVVAVLKAFGYSNRSIGWHYLLLTMVIALLGLAIGIVAGLWLGRGLGQLYMEYYRFPELRFHVTVWWFPGLALLTFAVAGLGGARSIRQAARLPPAEAMRPEGPASFRVNVLERIFSHVRISQPSRMILRQITRRPLRSGLSMLGVALATAIVMVGNFQFDSVAMMVHAQFARVQQQDAGLVLTDPVNAATLYGLNRLPGITYVEGRRSVAVELSHGHRKWRTALTGMPRDAALQHVIDAGMEAVRLPAEGVLLTDFLAEALAVVPGDSLTVKVLEEERQEVEVQVAGITSEFMGVGAYMSLPAINRLLQEGPVVNEALVNLEEARATGIYDQFRDMPGVLTVNIRQSMLDSFYNTLAKTFLTFTFFNGLLGGVIAFGVIYNTVRISLAEKGRELASMRVLGYSRQEVAHVLFGELALLLVLGIPMGWLVGHGLSAALVLALQTELYRVPLIITNQTLALSASIVLLSALGSGVVAWRRLSRLNLVAVLKTRE